MFSSLQAVIDWAADTFELPVSTYPQANDEHPFVVVNRTGGECAYPHDYPRFGIQFWAESDAEGEVLAFACAMQLESLLSESDRINAVGTPEITQLGLVDGGGFVWEVGVSLSTNIYE